MSPWDNVTVFELADKRRELFTDGDWIESPSITTVGNRLLQTGNVGVGKMLNNGKKRFVSDASFTALRCKEVRPGDVLICRLADPAGRACLVTDIGERRMLTSVDVTIFRPDVSRVDRRFLVAVFSTPEWFHEVAERCGGSTRTRIARSELGRIQVTLPPLAEQARIADALADADRFIDSLERLIGKKQAIKQGMMQQLLTGRTRLPGFEASWSYSTIGDLAQIVSGGTPKSSVPSYWDGGVAWCTPTDITREHGRLLGRTERTISKEGLERSAAQLLPVGSLLLCTRATIGEVKIAAIPIATNQGFKSLVPRAQVAGEYLYYKLLTLKDDLVAKGTGSTFLEVSKRDVSTLGFEAPIYNEQVAIALVLDDADDEIALLQQRVIKARSIKQGMMQQLLSGRTRLPVEANS